VPLSAAALVVAALAIGLVAPLREQFLLSVSHRESSYVELAFTPGPTGLVQPCSAARGAVEVRFALAAHGDAAGERTWRIRISAPSGAARTKALRGSSRLPEGSPVGVRREVRWSGPYDVTVSLPGTTQHLVAHCGRTS
jgi:hypothetical protein